MYLSLVIVQLQTHLGNVGVTMVFGGEVEQYSLMIYQFKITLMLVLMVIMFIYLIIKLPNQIVITNCNQFT